MPARKVVTNKQLNLLINYMETDHSFAIDCTASMGNSSTTKHVIRQKWEGLATKLNAVGGANKNGFKWRDYWFEKKCAVRKKAQQRLRQDTGKESPKKNSKLSTTELRILSLVSNDAVKPNLSVRIPFDGSSADTPSRPAPISATLPPVCVQDPSAGPSARRQYVQVPATITMPEQMSPPIAEEPPQWTPDFDDRLTAEELKEVSIEQLIDSTDLIKDATNMQIATIASIERDLLQLKDITGDPARIIVAGIDRLIEFKDKKLIPNEKILSTIEQLKAGTELLKVATEKYTAAGELQRATMKSMEEWMMQFSKDNGVAANHIVKDIYRVAGAEVRKIDPMEQNIIKATERLKAAIERLIASNKPIERAMLQFQEIVEISTDRVVNGTDRFIKAFPQDEKKLHKTSL